MADNVCAGALEVCTECSARGSEARIGGPRPPQPRPAPQGVPAPRVPEGRDDDTSADADQLPDGLAPLGGAEVVKEPAAHHCVEVIVGEGQGMHLPLDPLATALGQHAGRVVQGEVVAAGLEGLTQAPGSRGCVQDATTGGAVAVQEPEDHLGVTAPRPPTPEAIARVVSASALCGPLRLSTGHGASMPARSRVRAGSSARRQSNTSRRQANTSRRQSNTRMATRVPLAGPTQRVRGASWHLGGRPRFGARERPCLGGQRWELGALAEVRDDPADEDRVGPSGQPLATMSGWRDPTRTLGGHDGRGEQRSSSRRANGRSVGPSR